MATYFDAFKNIYAIHKLLMHFSKQYLPFFSFEFSRFFSYIS